MYTYRISITSDIADIYGTFSQEKPLTYGDFTREIRALMPADDEAKEILGWIFEATVTFLSIFVITAALLAFFGILDIHII